ncbi:hypothetical protein [Christiangramia salexigens]|uniref:Uncharacterized protein n=1 Tax=Christiangramia salexigens TaxID=1913577 RepID=A0A1L3J425_9FLAO|nr:hypothetical protein [Christiangramia salexigens]APG59862.1 hypothetical protein LPB144_05285 [Christiangramia salexigens]
MKRWNFKLKSNPNVISENLKSSLNSDYGFVLIIKNEGSDLILFKIRKWLNYAWYIIYHNNVIVNGRLSKTDTDNETNVEISFKQHLLWKLVIFTHLVLGLIFVIAIILSKNTGVAMYSLALGTIAVGIFLRLRLQKKHERNIEEYRTLISEILELK